MRYDWQNINNTNWGEFAAFDEEMYMPLWKKVIMCISAAIIPIVGSIDKISF